MTENRRPSELKAFLENAEYFGTIFNSDKVKEEVGCIERHFDTPGGMHSMLSRIIASSYDRVRKSAVKVGGYFAWLHTLESVISKHIDVFL